MKRTVCHAFGLTSQSWPLSWLVSFIMEEYSGRVFELYTPGQNGKVTRTTASLLYFRVTVSQAKFMFQILADLPRCIKGQDIT